MKRKKKKIATLSQSLSTVAAVGFSSCSNEDEVFKHSGLNKRVALVDSRITLPEPLVSFMN